MPVCFLGLQSLALTKANTAFKTVEKIEPPLASEITLEAMVM
jgi:hypothetical protein